MRKKINNVARVILAFSIAIMLTNCEQENIDVNSQDASVTNAKNWFEKSNPELTILKETKQIDWDHAIVTDGAKGKVVEVPIVLKDNLAVKGDDKSLTTHNRLMFIVDEKGIYKLSHVLITTKESKFTSGDKDFNFYKIRGDFEGYITILNAKNKVSYINAITKKASSITSKMKNEDQVCLAMCKMYDDGSYDVLYIISCGGGGSSGGSGGGYGGDDGVSETTPAETVKQIYDELTGKAKCLNDLLSKNGNTFVQKVLANFAGKSEFDIKIVSVDKVFSANTGLEINGNTTPPINNIIVINISTTKTNEHSSLDAVRTILHEYIHADIFRKLNTKYDASEALDFKKTYDAYGNQHGTMAGLYLQSMKEALKEFHKNVLIDDYNKYTNYYGEAPSDDFYEALAWGGLKDSNVKAWTDLSTTQQASIQNLASRANLLTKTVPCQ